MFYLSRCHLPYRAPVKGVERVLHSFASAALPPLFSLLQIKALLSSDNDVFLQELLLMLRDFADSHIASLPPSGTYVYFVQAHLVLSVSVNSLKSSL
jgi:hypothetical protein